MDHQRQFNTVMKLNFRDQSIKLLSQDLVKKIYKLLEIDQQLSFRIVPKSNNSLKSKRISFHVIINENKLILK